MNQFFVVAIAEKISAIQTAQFFENRAALTAAGAADAAWGKVGTQAVVKGDEWAAKP